MRALRAVLLALLYALVAEAGAHDLALSGIRLIVRRSDTVVSVSLHRTKLQAMEGSGSLSKLGIDLAIRRRLKLRIDGNDFVARESHLIDDEPNDLVTWQATAKYPGERFEVSARLCPENPEARTVVTVAREGVVTQEVVLDQVHPTWLRNQTAASNAEVGKRFLVQGVEHILSGWDHILFVLGLILLGGGLKSLIKTVTAFTVAHSVTLALAATGVWNPPARVVEPLIALSIVGIAVENLRTKSEVRSRDFRPLVAFLFGLVHGFGFAGALVDVGLQGPALAWALVTFNIGVECGQGAVILASAPLVAWASKLKPTRWASLASAGSIVIGLIGSYWFIARLTA